MKKSLTLALFSLCLCIAFTACASLSQKDSARPTAEEYLEEFQFVNKDGSAKKIFSIPAEKVVEIRASPTSISHFDTDSVTLFWKKEDIEEVCSLLNSLEYTDITYDTSPHAGDNHRCSDLTLTFFGDFESESYEIDTYRVIAGCRFAPEFNLGGDILEDFYTRCRKIIDESPEYSRDLDDDWENMPEYPYLKDMSPRNDFLMPFGEITQISGSETYDGEEVTLLTGASAKNFLYELDLGIRNARIMDSSPDLTGECYTLISENGSQKLLFCNIGESESYIAVEKDSTWYKADSRGNSVGAMGQMIFTRLLDKLGKRY